MVEDPGNGGGGDPGKAGNILDGNSHENILL